MTPLEYITRQGWRIFPCPTLWFATAYPGLIDAEHEARKATGGRR